MDDGPGPPFLVGTRLIRPWLERFRLTAQWNENALPEPGGSRRRSRYLVSELEDRLSEFPHEFLGRGRTVGEVRWN